MLFILFSYDKKVEKNYLLVEISLDFDDKLNSVFWIEKFLKKINQLNWFHSKSLNN
jgi:hypothetical protein